MVLRKNDLMKRMTDGKRLTFVSAPSGYGKTTAVQLWTQQSDLAPLFVSLSETHNDSASFFKAVTSCLTVRPGENEPETELSGIPGEETVFSSSAMRIVRLLCNRSSGYALVFDDFHLIHNDYIEKMIISFFNRIPAGCRMFLISRQPPPVSFEPLRVKGLMTCLDAEDLRFRADEIVGLAEMNGRTLTLEEADEAVCLTEGWPIAVHAFLHGKGICTEGRGLIFEFFENVVWRSCDEATKSAMLCSCVADVLMPSLLAALTGEAHDERTLLDICGKNAFLTRIHGDSYRFHSLFREFLQEKMTAAGLSRKELCRKTAGWYARNDLPYMAVKYYMEAGCWDEMVPSLYLLFSRADDNCSVEEHYHNIQTLELSRFPDEFMKKSVYLYETRAWGYYLGGQSELLAKDMDAFGELLSEVSNKNSQGTATLFCTVDHRKKLSEIVDELYMYAAEYEQAPLAHTASLSQNLPLFHRSYRDHSDYAMDTETKLHKMRETLGKLVGREYNAIENCIRAGIYYEKGLMNMAYSYALRAVSEVGGDIPPETAFCAHIILASVLYALEKTQSADEMVTEIHANVIKRESLYLMPNLQAFAVRIKLYRGDSEAAFNWLQTTDAADKGPLLFYKIYRYFTTAKAYIAIRALDLAIPFLEKLLSLCEDYDRTLDVVDACILLSIALREKKRKKEADDMLIRAVKTAGAYGFIQPFVLECDSLAAELGRLSHRVMQPEYNNGLDGAFVKSLYLTTSRAAKAQKDIGYSEEACLSERQAQLIGLLSEGYNTRDISEETGLKPSTVKTYLKVAYQKLGAAGKRDAVAKAYALGIISSGGGSRSYSQRT